MLHIYTPEIVGGPIMIKQSGVFKSDDHHTTEGLINIKGYKHGQVIAIFFEKTKTIKIVSNVELKFEKDKNFNIYYGRFNTPDDDIE